MIRQVTFENTYNGFPIITQNNGETMGCYTPILDGIYRLISGMVEKHNKVYFLRFDLRFPVNNSYGSDNTVLSRFTEALIKHYNREKLDPKYLWCRERVNSENSHYHFIFLINGNKVQNPYGVLNKATDLWGKCLQVDASGLVNFCMGQEGYGENGTMIIRNSADFNEKFGLCFYRASYLAKVYSKGNRPKGIREYGMSRL